jgi:hypothetical protein
MFPCEDVCLCVLLLLLLFCMCLSLSLSLDLIHSMPTCFVDCAASSSMPPLQPRWLCYNICGPSSWSRVRPQCELLHSALCSRSCQRTAHTNEPGDPPGSVASWICWPRVKPCTLVYSSWMHIFAVVGLLLLRQVLCVCVSVCVSV